MFMFVVDALGLVRFDERRWLMMILIQNAARQLCIGQSVTKACVNVEETLAALG